MKKILLVLTAISLFFISCTTQAKKYDGEPESCFQARYMAREKQGSAVGQISDTLLLGMIGHSIALIGLKAWEDINSSGDK